MSVVSPRWGKDGWPLGADPYPGADVDPINNAQHVKDIYLKVNPEYDGRFTVPLIYDKKEHTIVNNESAEIIRMFNSAFDDILPEKFTKVDTFPEALRKQIEEVNEWVYDTVSSELPKCLIHLICLSISGVRQMECTNVA